MKENAAYNEQFVGECLKKIRKAPDAEEGLNQLLRFLGERLECDRVYVFEEMDRQHIHNTYEWCSRADIPVVFLTAHSDAQTAKEGMEAGGFAFLTKPYDVEELQRAVTDAMDRKAGVFA
ncbi:response regulator [Eisenbergiella tayi]|uniref:response regulator n=1 Tax=Eisenbergiella tayi TaxID=1432052 RepID=UPI00084857DA|nr:response regulator [Eisenbergiella tayi]ODR42421.1 hypothetical protein BEI60_03005 [Eisenbergiella tayi]